MKNYLQQYRPFFIFLFKFFAVYVVLTVLYQLYLGSFDAQKYEVDGFTASVAKQSEWLLNLFTVAHTEPHPMQQSIKVSINGDYLARIVEGCNALSVMILFTAFVVAFQGRLKHTLLFIVFGCLLIHLLNIIRIALLTAGLAAYPEYGEFLHGIVFPLFIYGVVFILWIVWVNRFSSYAGKK